VGAAAWSYFADRTGVAGDTGVPFGALLATVVVTLVAAALIAVVPARTARRTEPAVVLREV
jgi:hypothetical protein